MPIIDNLSDLGCYYSALVLAFINIVICILLAVKNYKANMLMIYQGRHHDIPPASDYQPKALLLAAAKYVGFQAAYATWGEASTLRTGSLAVHRIGFRFRSSVSPAFHYLLSRLCVFQLTVSLQVSGDHHKSLAVLLVSGLTFHLACPVMRNLFQGYHRSPSSRIRSSVHHGPIPIHAEKR